MKKQKKFFQPWHWFKIIALGVAVGLSLQFVRAWTEPSVAPPGGNLGAPINTGANSQYKSGILGVDKLQLGGRWLLSGIGDAHGNDGWLRLFDVTGSGFWGGIAAANLYSGGNTYLCGFNNTYCRTYLSDDGYIEDSNDGFLRLNMVYGGNFDVLNGDVCTNKGGKWSCLSHVGSLPPCSCSAMDTYWGPFTMSCGTVYYDSGSGFRSVCLYPGNWLSPFM